MFVPVSHIRLRHWSRGNGSDGQERAREKDHHRGSNNVNVNGHHFNNTRLSHHQQQPSRHVIFQQHHPSSPPPQQASGILSRAVESVPVVAQGHSHVRSSASPPPFQVGQRVCFPLDDGVYGGEVRFCGLLPGRSSSGMYVGVLLVSTFPFYPAKSSQSHVQRCNFSPLFLTSSYRTLLLVIGMGFIKERNSARFLPICMDNLCQSTKCHLVWLLPFTASTCCVSLHSCMQINYMQNVGNGTRGQGLKMLIFMTNHNCFFFF